MKIACLQFAPAVADVDANIEVADAILEKADPDDLDLLVLPELAFTGASPPFARTLHHRVFKPGFRYGC